MGNDGHKKFNPFLFYFFSIEGKHIEKYLNAKEEL